MRSALVLLAACSGGGSFVASGGTGDSSRLALSGDSLYWASATGAVVRAPLGGGIPAEISTTPWVGVPAIGANSTHVFWSSPNGMLARAEIGGGEDSLAIAADLFAVDDERLVFADPTGLASVELPGLAERPLLAARQISAVALDGDRLFGATCDGGADLAGLWRIDVPTGTATPLGGRCSDFLVLDDQFIYSVSIDFELGFQGIVRTPKIGGESVPILDLALGAFAVRDGFVYAWRDGVIVRITAEGEDSTVVASTSVAPAGIAVDDTMLYWVTNQLEPRLNRVALP